MWLSSRGLEEGSARSGSTLKLGQSGRRTDLLRFVFAAAVFLATLATAHPPDGTAGAPRAHTTLEDSWRTIVAASADAEPSGWTRADFDDRAWRAVTVPHNWDAYHGFRQVKHGNLHGTAWYRRTFSVGPEARGRRVFLFFEGVGSYATVWVNGRQIGEHAGGLTTFTLDVTDAVHFDAPNLLALRAEHPAGIRDLPWVCGGCERVIGFSEGSQPLGIFRPVHVIVTDPLRIEPFGIHVWNDADASVNSASVHLRTEIRNHGGLPRSFVLRLRLLDEEGHIALEHTSAPTSLGGGESCTLAYDPAPLRSPRLWSLASPHLYTAINEVVDPETQAVLDRSTTSFGIRTLRWPAPGNAQADGRFFLNEEAVFINGTAEYEHLLGGSHAFSAAQVATRVRQIEAAGFNAFRDAHTPHNLRYGDHWARDGVLWWPQFSAHAWFDNDRFRAHFKARLRDWVRERRNNPAVMLWGLQNESKVPTAFAAECAALIRELDPSASTQRLITTCNGGTGTDWDVPQNWSGTYGGDPATYADDLRRQRLVGEFGAWRSLGLHTEGGFDPKGPYSEERMTALMETKVRLGEAARDAASGHFAWLFATHANPGRDIGENGEQARDGWRDLDHVGPANNKGLLTIWGEPLDVFYMFRSNYAPAATQPMVYIASHTWPNRWTEPGRKNGIVVYSNCDEVELFNDWRRDSLGMRTRDGRGTHFRWDDVDVRHNVLYAEGRIDGRVVATDIIVLHHLPAAPEFTRREAAQPSVAAPEPGRNYLYRINCGGADYLDTHGSRWLADRNHQPGDSWGSLSWAAPFPNLAPDVGSRRKIHDPIENARDDALFQTFRYGREQLRYRFAVPDGSYRIELYFIEPWYGTGGGLDCTGWRLFDVAVNGRTRVRDLDIWKEAGGRARVLKKVLEARADDGELEISFPRVSSYQAVLSAIAISTNDPHAKAPALPLSLVEQLRGADASLRSDLDHGDLLHAEDAADTIVTLPEALRGTDWIQLPRSNARSAATLRFRVSADTALFVAWPDAAAGRPAWLGDWHDTGKTLASRRSRYVLLQKDLRAGTDVALPLQQPEGSPAAVIIKRAYPLPPPQIVQHFEATAGVQAVGHLKSGYPVSPDRSATFAKIPAVLSDADWLQLPACAELSARARFTVNDHVEIYVAPRAQGAALPWLTDWIETTLTIGTSHGATLRLFKKRYPAGQEVALELADLATVMIRAVRSSTVYEAEAAAFDGGTILAGPTGFTGRGAVKLSVNADARIGWTVTVGVGARYGLNFRYINASAAPITAELQIVDGEGRVMRADPVEFKPGIPSGAWTFLRTRTGVSINAGTYQLRLVRLQGSGPIVFDSLEVE